MRLFAAVLFDKDTLERIHEYRNRFREAALSGNFSSKSNYHITVRFFGEVEPEAVRPICRALEKSASVTAPFRISSYKPGVFRRNEGSVLWVGIDRGRKELWNLADIVEDELFSIGIPKEEKPFKAHITLGRKVNFRDEFSHVVQELGAFSFLSEAKGISLMESTRERGALVYRELYFFPFGKNQ